MKRFFLQAERLIDWDVNEGLLVNGEYPAEILDRWNRAQKRAVRVAYKLPSDAEVVLYTGTSPPPDDAMTGIIDLSDPKYDDDELTNHNAFLGVFSEEWIEELVALVAEQFRKEKGALKTPEGTTSPPACMCGIAIAEASRICAELNCPYR